MVSSSGLASVQLAWGTAGRPPVCLWNTARMHRAPAEWKLVTLLPSLPFEQQKIIILKEKRRSFAVAQHLNPVAEVVIVDPRLLLSIAQSYHSQGGGLIPAMWGWEVGTAQMCLSLSSSSCNKEMKLFARFSNNWWALSIPSAPQSE